MGRLAYVQRWAGQPIRRCQSQASGFHPHGMLQKHWHPVTYPSYYGHVHARACLQRHVAAFEAGRALCSLLGKVRLAPT